jgi:hypothetical protein
MTPLTIHEWQTDAGARETVDVGAEDGALVVHVAGSETALPMAVLEGIMDRFGKPLDEAVALEGPSVDLGAGGTLWRIRHRGFYDVIARDFLVWRGPGREPVVELATAVSAALVHFVEVARGQTRDG